MLKLWIVVVVLAAPILCEVNKGGQEKLFFKNVRNYIKEECEERFHSHRREYIDCMEDAKHVTEFLRDFQKYFSNLTMNSNPTVNRNEIIDVFQKHCPTMDKSFKCEEIMTPIHNACFPSVVTFSINLGKEISVKAYEFFCKNDFERVTKHIDAKIIECGMSKKEELMQCFGNNSTLFLDSEITTQVVCSLVENLENCVISKFEQCTLSQTAGTVVKSFFNDIQKGTACENFTTVS